MGNDSPQLCSEVRVLKPIWFDSGGARCKTVTLVGKPFFEKSFQLIDKIKFLLYNIYDENLNFHIIFLPYNRR